jgi:DNA polymerase III delta prime subunit
MQDNPVWVEKYRPPTVADTILPESLKQNFQEIVNTGQMPNMIFSGPPGIGKTTIAKALASELGMDCLVINGSLSGNIDTLRNEIQDFASTVSFKGGRKLVILDEADYLNPNSTQPALRNFMEEFSRNCAFILTCNFVNKIIEPLRSRCSTIDFHIPKTDGPKLQLQFFKRVCTILEAEKITFDNRVVAQVVAQYFPDWRRALNELQRYSVKGEINTGILAQVSDEAFKTLVGILKSKSFSSLRKWVAESADSDVTVYRKVYDGMSGFLKPTSIPGTILVLAKYQFQHAFAADPEINLVACLTEIMASAEFI